MHGSCVSGWRQCQADGSAVGTCAPPYLRSEQGLARELAEERRRAGRASEGSGHACEAPIRRWVWLCFADRHFEAAREHFERAIELFGPDRFATSGSDAITHNWPRAPAERAAEPWLSVNRAQPGSASRWPPRAGAPIPFPFRRFVHGGDEPSSCFGTAAQRRSTPRRCFPSPPSTEWDFSEEVLFFHGWAMSAGGQGKEGIAEMRRAISDSSSAMRRPRPAAGHSRRGLSPQWTSRRRP